MDIYRSKEYEEIKEFMLIVEIVITVPANLFFFKNKISKLGK